MTTLAVAQEAPPLKIAVIRINSLTNGGNLYDKFRMANCDKATLEAMKKINKELSDLQKQIIDTEDELKLGDLGRRMNFLNQKLNTLRQRSMSGNPNMDIQEMVRKFVVERYKDKYSIILQQDSGDMERAILWKGNLQFDDITDDAAQKLREQLDSVIGD
jgi:hypothetical protein